MPRHLILLEDEPILRKGLADFLRSEEWAVEAVGSILEFRQRYDAALHHIAIIDLGLPDGDGMELIRELRGHGNPLGIVVLTARNAHKDRLGGLMDGADYYLPKAADLDEIAATLTALSRRIGGIQPGLPTWLLEGRNRVLTPPGHAPIALSHQDFVVLSALMARAGNNVSRQEIVAALGGDWWEYDQRRLTVQIRRLRSKVEEATQMSLPIKTSRNAGYCFAAPVTIRD